jgi:hypothetical protein
MRTVLLGGIAAFGVVMFLTIRSENRTVDAATGVKRQYWGDNSDMTEFKNGVKTDRRIYLKKLYEWEPKQAH